MRNPSTFLLAAPSTTGRKCAPVNLPGRFGVEIDSDVADGPHSVILHQVTNGVAVRMAALYLLAGGAPEKADCQYG